MEPHHNVTNITVTGNLLSASNKIESFLSWIIIEMVKYSSAMWKPDFETDSFVAIQSKTQLYI